MRANLNFVCGNDISQNFLVFCIAHKNHASTVDLVCHTVFLNNVSNYEYMKFLVG